MGIKIKKVIFGLLTLACLVGIFAFSCQVAIESDSVSRSITERILAFVSDYDQLSVDAQQLELAQFNEVIRSLAHFSIFLFLGFFLYLFLRIMGAKRPFVVSYVVCVLYAVSDEIHQQFFTEGRAFQLVDLAKDWSGSLVGVLAAMAIASIVVRIRKKS